MSNVYGRWKMAWLASSVAICAVTEQVRGGGFNRARETHPLLEIYTQWQILASFLPLKLLTYCKYPGKGELRYPRSALFLLKSRPRSVWVQRPLVNNLIINRW